METPEQVTRRENAIKYAQERANITGQPVRVFRAYGQIHVAHATADFAGDTICVVRPEAQ